MSTPELRRILLVEDEILIQLVASMALEDIGGFEVEVCSSGRLALQRAPHFAPHLILLDVMMPDLDGLGTFAAMSEDAALQDIPVVFMTARAQQQEMEEYRASGAIDVIVKPFDAMAMPNTVLAIWQRHHGASDDS